MTSKKLGALLQSVPPATARPIADISPAEPLSRPEPITRRMEAPAPVAREEPEVPLQVLIPAHIREELGIMVAKERTSLRALILRAVRSLGIEVTDEEVRGKRGRRPGRNSRNHEL
jgi:hypothetical protein